MKTLLFILTLTATLHGAEPIKEIKLTNGTLLKDVDVKRVTAAGLEVDHRDGAGLVIFDLLPADIKKQYAMEIEKAREAADLPEPAHKPIAGLAPAEMYLSLEKQGFRTKRMVEPAQCLWTSRQQAPRAEMTVGAIGSKPTEVNFIQGTCVAAQQDDGAAAKDFLSELASVPYTGADPAKAKQWVVDHINTPHAKTTIGGATFHIMVPPKTPFVRILRITSP